MKKEVYMSPEELYYLSSVLNADYIDYAYLAAMSQYGGSEDYFRNEAKASLAGAGVLTEDFSGTVVVDAEIQELLKPIFKGKTETSLDVCTPGEDAKIVVYKFHFLDGAITMVTESDGKLLIRSIDGSYLDNLIQSFLPSEYTCGESAVVPKVDEKNVTLVLVAKSIKIDDTSVVKAFFECGGAFYCFAEAKDYKVLTKDMFVDDLSSIIKGE